MSSGETIMPKSAVQASVGSETGAQLEALLRETSVAASIGPKCTRPTEVGRGGDWADSGPRRSSLVGATVEPGNSCLCASEVSGALAGDGAPLPTRSARSTDPSRTIPATIDTQKPPSRKIQTRWPTRGPGPLLGFGNPGGRHLTRQPPVNSGAQVHPTLWNWDRTARPHCMSPSSENPSACPRVCRSASHELEHPRAVDAVKSRLGKGAPRTWRGASARQPTVRAERTPS